MKRSLCKYMAISTIKAAAIVGLALGLVFTASLGLSWLKDAMDFSGSHVQLLGHLGSELLRGAIQLVTWPNIGGVVASIVVLRFVQLTYYVQYLVAYYESGLSPSQNEWRRILKMADKLSDIEGDMIIHGVVITVILYFTVAIGFLINIFTGIEFGLESKSVVTALLPLSLILFGKILLRVFWLLPLAKSCRVQALKLSDAPFSRSLESIPVIRRCANLMFHIGHRSQDVSNTTSQLKSLLVPLT